MVVCSPCPRLPSRYDLVPHDKVRGASREAPRVSVSVLAVNQFSQVTAALHGVSLRVAQCFDMLFCLRKRVKMNGAVFAFNHQSAGTR